jgi:hypothetical protein
MLPVTGVMDSVMAGLLPGWTAGPLLPPALGSAV